MSEHTDSRLFLRWLVLLATALALWVIRPFASALFLAAVVAATLEPLTRWMAPRLRGRRLPAAILTVGLLLIGLVPLGVVIGVVVNETLGAFDWVRSTLHGEGVAGIVAGLPRGMRRTVLQAINSLPHDSDSLVKLIKEQGDLAVAALGGALSATGRVFFQSALFLVALFFLIADGPKLATWVGAALPLRPGHFQKLRAEFRAVTVAALSSTFATAAVQAVVATGGYLLAGVPRVSFFALLTFLFALIPAVGATSVVLFLAVLKWSGGQSGAALFLALWGIAVGLSDNVVKPFLMRGQVEINSGVIFFSLIGGLLGFGPVGIVAGPLVATFLIAVVKMEREERQAPDRIPPPA